MEYTEETLKMVKENSTKGKGKGKDAQEMEKAKEAQQKRANRTP